MGEAWFWGPIPMGTKPQDLLRFFLKNPKGVQLRYGEGWGEGASVSPLFRDGGTVSPLKCHKKTFRSLDEAECFILRTVSGCNLMF
jgi:hypothetical protein